MGVGRSSRAAGHGHGSGPDRRLRRLRRQASVRRRWHRRGPHPRRWRPGHPRLRLRPGIQHLDDHRGVPQPADHLGERRLAHHRAIQRAGDVPVSRGHRRRSSASTWSTRRSCSCRATCPAARQEGDVQVRARLGLHRQAQDHPRPGHGPHGQGPRQGRRRSPARRPCRDHARSGQGGRPDDRPRDRGHVGHRPQGRQAARGLPVPDDGRAGVLARPGTRRRRAGRPASTP